MTPPQLSCPYVSMGNRFQDPPQIPKSTVAQVPSIKWHRTIHTVSLPHHRLLTTDRKKYRYVLKKKNPHISGATQFNPCHSKVSCIILFMTFTNNTVSKGKDILILTPGTRHKQAPIPCIPSTHLRTYSSSEGGGPRSWWGFPQSRVGNIL